jgi:hypothetical protein
LVIERAGSGEGWPRGADMAAGPGKVCKQSSPVLHSGCTDSRNMLRFASVSICLIKKLYPRKHSLLLYGIFSFCNLTSLRQQPERDERGLVAGDYFICVCLTVLI